MRLFPVAFAAACLAIAAPAFAAPPVAGQPGAAPGPVTDMAPVVVRGAQPGPGMWKVHGPDGHVLWVLGTVSPLPAGMEWRAGEVRSVIERAGVVLGPPSLTVNADVGFFGGMALVPSALRARRNPDGKRLEDVLTDAQHARWTSLKKRYLGWELGIERWRPMFAAQKLFNAALDKHGLARDVVDSVVSDATRDAGRTVTPVALRITIEEPRALLKDMHRSELDDVPCLDRTMSAIERRLPVLVARANAWATGDVGMLRQLATADAEGECLMDLLDTRFVQRQDVGDIPARVRATWLEAAEEALAEHETAFAMLSMEQVLADEGYLADLAARGYRIEAP